MPALPVIANVFRCAWIWSCSSGGYAVNVTHWGDLTLAASESDLWEEMDDQLTANQWASVSSSAHIQRVQIQKLDGVSAVHEFGQFTHGSGGTGAATIPASAALIKLSTNLRGRSHRGRLYLPFTSEEATENQNLSAAVVAAMQTAWDAFHANMTGASWDWIIASYKLAAGTEINGVQVITPIATQRRRQERLRV